ncbi:MAG: GrpB family protein [Limnochordia bacterium]|jgi:GrpB-like predicted nucleotidyltransferase (UPF0157 family)
MERIVVKDYDPDWPLVFEELKAVYKRHLKGLPVDIQHVGSTSVVGLAAKPIIDIDLIVPDEIGAKQVIAALCGLGYPHEGNLGIPGREAMRHVNDQVPMDGSGRIWMKHHLYVCLAGSSSLENHLKFRDYLRLHRDKAIEYGQLKQRLARMYPDDIGSYIEKKTPFILGILREVGFSREDQDSIKKQNLRKKDI